MTSRGQLRLKPTLSERLATSGTFIIYTYRPTMYQEPPPGSQEAEKRSWVILSTWRR